MVKKLEPCIQLRWLIKHKKHVQFYECVGLFSCHIYGTKLEDSHVMSDSKFQPHFYFYSVMRMGTEEMALSFWNFAQFAFNKTPATKHKFVLPQYL